MAKIPKWLSFRNVVGSVVLFYAAAASLGLPVPRWTWIWEHEALAQEFYNAKLTADLREYRDLDDRICEALDRGKQPRSGRLDRWRELADEINRVSRKLKRKPVEAVRPRC